MLKDCIELPSVGPLLVGGIALSLAIFQGWFFIRHRQQVWVGWGTLVSLAAAFYGVTIFINYNAVNDSLLIFNERCQYSAQIFIIHTIARLVFSLFERHSRLANRLFMLIHLGWLALVWFTDLVVSQHLIARHMAWLAHPYIEPAQGPLGPFFFLYCLGNIVLLYRAWWRNRHRKVMGLNYVVGGFSFWAVFVIHDVWGTLGHPVGAFLMEYGFLGFCFALAGVSIKRHFILEKNLRQAQKLEILARLAGGIAHDFNNLLTIISVNTQLMLTHTDRGDPKRLGLERIMKAGKRGEDLVRSLLALGRQDGAAEGPLDLNQAINGSAQLLAPALPPSISLELKLTPGLPPVMGNGRQIEQIVLNLGINARDAMPQGGRLTVATSPLRLQRKGAASAPNLRPGDYVLMTVADTGLGMDEETLQQAFDPFFSTKPSDKGSGLGLAMVRGLMEARGGAITCWSNPGLGSVFSLYWPAGDLPTPEAPPAAPAEVACPEPGQWLLMVDDEADLLDSQAELLQLHGYHVLKARSGQEAIEVFRSHPVDLVVLDLHMPGMDARECLRHLRDMHPGVKVLVVSGDLVRAKQALPAGGNVVGHLAKPVPVHQLLQGVARAL